MDLVRLYLSHLLVIKHTKCPAIHWKKSERTNRVDNHRINTSSILLLISPIWHLSWVAHSQNNCSEFKPALALCGICTDLLFHTRPRTQMDRHNGVQFPHNWHRWRPTAQFPNVHRTVIYIHMTRYRYTNSSSRICRRSSCGRIGHGGRGGERFHLN